MDIIFKLINSVNYYSKEIYEKYEKSYLNKEWFINFQSRMSKLGKLNLNDSHQDIDGEEVKLKEDEEMKNYIPKGDSDENFE